MRKVLSICFLIFLFQANIFGQRTTVDSFSIKQTILPEASPQFKYVFEKNTLTVYQTKYSRIKKDLIDKKLYRMKLSDRQIDSLNSILINLAIESLDTLYSKPMLDGVFWTFEFQLKKGKKKVVLDNYYHAKLDGLLIYLNKQLPEKWRLISLGVFDTD